MAFYLKLKNLLKKTTLIYFDRRFRKLFTLFNIIN